jgi:hypothetical protein
MSGTLTFVAATEAHRRGDLAAAEAGYRNVLGREPRHPEALFWLGTIVTQRGNVAEGVPLLERAVELNPRIPGGQHHLGNVYRQLDRPEAAVRHLRRAAVAEPGNAEVHNNLAGVLIKLGVYAEADLHLRRALAIDPKFRPAMVNLGALTEITGRYDETIGWYDRALALQPDDPDTRFQRAGALLIRGRLAEGWPEYRSRFARPQRARLYGTFPFPYWSGEPLAGRHILVWMEQGLGEEILTATMLPDLVRLAGAVTLICSPRLATLFERAFPQVRIIAALGNIDGRLLAGVDVQASMSELGEWLRPSLTAFPPRQPLLTATAERTAALRSKYRADAGDKMLVGISWRSKSPEAEAEKSIPLAAWREILSTPGIAWVNLQYGDCSDEISETERALGVRLFSDPEIDPLGDLEDLAAQVAAMDLVISVSNTTVHLAGALGQEVLALVPSDRGRLWYWFLDRNDSPWYPRVRLCRKAIGKSWDTALGEAGAALAQKRQRQQPREAS